MSLRTSVFLAFRYLRPRLNLTTVSTFLAVLGPIIGVSVLVVVASVMNGFHAEIEKRFFGFSSHILIYGTPPHLPILNLSQIMDRLQKEGFSASPVIQTPSLIQLAGGMVYHQFLGIDPATERDVTQFFEKCQFAYAGRTYDFRQAFLNLQDGEVICGVGFLRQHGLKIGDRLVIHPLAKLERMIKTQPDGTIHISTKQGTYLPLELKIVGAFNFDMYQIDTMVSIITRDQAAELAGLDWGDATIVRVKAQNPFSYPEIIRKLSTFPEFQTLLIRSWRDENENLFQALQIEKTVMIILLILIVVVSAFCVCATLITIVSQKVHEIGILKALGADPLTIMTIFIVQGGLIGGGGALGGTLLGLGMVWIRNDFLAFCRRHLEANLMPQALYFFHELPAKIERGDILIINLSTFFLCVLAGIFPAFIACLISPSRSIKGE